MLTFVFCLFFSVEAVSVSQSNEPRWVDDDSTVQQTFFAHNKVGAANINHLADVHQLVDNNDFSHRVQITGNKATGRRLNDLAATVASSKALAHQKSYKSDNTNIDETTSGELDYTLDRGRDLTVLKKATVVAPQFSHYTHSLKKGPGKPTKEERSGVNMSPVQRAGNRMFNHETQDVVSHYGRQIATTGGNSGNFDLDLSGEKSKVVPDHDFDDGTNVLAKKLVPATLAGTAFAGDYAQSDIGMESNTGIGDNLAMTNSAVREPTVAVLSSNN